MEEKTKLKRSGRRRTFGKAVGNPRPIAEKRKCTPCNKKKKRRYR